MPDAAPTKRTHLGSRPWHDLYDPGVPVDVAWDSQPLDRLLRSAAVRYPNRSALVFFDREIDYTTLDKLVDGAAAGLQRLGLRRGDRVSVFMPNCPQLVIAYEAIWRCGGVVVPSNPQYTSSEFAHQARDAGSRIAIVLSMLYERVRQVRDDLDLEQVGVTNIKEYFSGPTRALFTLLRERRGGHRVDFSADPGTHPWSEVVGGGAPRPVTVGAADTAVLMYTGGTTGVPKAAQLTHDNLTANVNQVSAFSPELRDGEEVMLTALPLTHSYAITVAMNQAMAKGFTQVLVPDPRDLVTVLKVIDHHEPTVFPGVPTLYSAISRHRHVRSGKYDVSSISYCISGAAALSPDVQNAFQEATGARLVEGYGLSEASPVTHCNPLAGADNAGAIGVPVPGTDCRIVDEETETTVLGPGERGVLCVSGPQVMAGYWNRSEETGATLVTHAMGTVWLHTGDIAVMEPDGVFAIVDRKKDLILAGGGLNVYPREVEEALTAHPLVMEAGVIGVPPGGEDQKVKAFVALEDGAELTETELLAYARERLARYKVPREIEVRAELPT
ncbi:MAG: long-chain fatty acid--CoA ligase, partial [Acidimicrobiia bacterium]